MRRVWTCGALLLTVSLAAWCGWGLARLQPRPGSEAALAALGAALTTAERAAILGGRLTVIDGQTALRWAKDGRTTEEGRLVVIVNIPGVFRPAGDDGARVLAITEAAVRLKARLMVDCTDADLARLTPPGRQSVTLARRAGIWRLVVFDGAHHVPPLATRPELLLVPILRAGGWPLVVHGYVRDALPLPQLLTVLRALGSDPAVFTLPRLSLPLKEAWPLRLVAERVLYRVATAPPRRPWPPRPGPHPSAGDDPAVNLQAGPGYLRLPDGRFVAVTSYGLFRPFSPRSRLARLRLPPEARRAPADLLRLGWPLSVWDLLLHHPAAVAGWGGLPREADWSEWGLAQR